MAPRDFDPLPHLPELWVRSHPVQQRVNAVTQQGKTKKKYHFWGACQ